MKKTVRLVELVNYVNGFNRTEVASPVERKVLNTLLESFLYNAGAYRGFRYLEQNDVPENCKPGIIRDETGKSISYPDPTRVEYFYIERGL